MQRRGFAGCAELTAGLTVTLEHEPTSEFAGSLHRRHVGNLDLLWCGYCFRLA